MKDYVVCIPSYKRSDVCKEKTLSTLKRHNIPSKKVYVFVANKEEYEVYKKAIPSNLYHKLIVGIVGLVPQRDFIEKYFSKGQPIVFMDDDVESVDLSLSPKFKNHSLHYFLKEAFEYTKKNNAYIWGVYPVFNPFFREPRNEVSDILNYIVGAFYGLINRPGLKSLELNITKEHGGQKEDVERTIKYFIEDGKVIRFNKIGFTTKYYGKEGGLGTFEQRLKPMLLAAKELEATYPEFGKVTTRKTGMTEFTLKKLKEVPERLQKHKSTKTNTTRKMKKSLKTKTRKSKK